MSPGRSREIWIEALTDLIEARISDSLRLDLESFRFSDEDRQWLSIRFQELADALNPIPKEQGK